MGVIERREREKNIRRERAIDAAMEIYKEEGYHSITMEKIAERSELSRAALYLYFKTKDEIFISAIVSHTNYFADLLEEVFDNKENFKQALLEKMWETFENYYEKAPDVFNATQYFHQSEIIRNLPDNLRDMLYKLGSRVVHLLQGIVQYAIKEGVFIKCDHRTLAEVIWTSFLGINDLERSKYVLSKNSHLKITRDCALKVLSRGILASGK
jgi:TetR/AcrR family transcriptional regulator